MNEKIAPEFDLCPPMVGYTMHGWDFSRAEIAEALAHRRMLNPAFELGTNRCPWRCFFCFTSSPDSQGLKKVLPGEISLERRLRLIDEAAELGTRSINVVGAGEPTIDPHFWELVEHIVARGMVPIVYTEGAIKLADRSNVERLHDLGVTVVLKVNSLTNRDYQDAVVMGNKEYHLHDSESYFDRRNRALDILLDVGFADHEPTRLAFDTIICKQNLVEIEAIHRFARSRNIFVLFVNYLPSGRSSSLLQDALNLEEQFGIFERLAEIDRVEYGISHRSIFPYAGGVPCTIRGLGLFVTITGDIFDCPGKSERLGNVADRPLAEAWEAARHITASFDGGCLPRHLFWQQNASGP